METVLGRPELVMGVHDLTPLKKDYCSILRHVCPFCGGNAKFTGFRLPPINDTAGSFLVCRRCQGKWCPSCRQPRHKARECLMLKYAQLHIGEKCPIDDSNNVVVNGKPELQRTPEGRIYTLEQHGDKSMQHNDFRTRIEYYRNHLGGVSTIDEPHKTLQGKIEIQEHGDTMHDHSDRIHALEQYWGKSSQHEGFRTPMDYYRNHLGEVSSIDEPQTTPQEHNEIQDHGDTMQEHSDIIHTLEQHGGKSSQHEDYRTRMDYYRNYTGGVSTIDEPHKTLQENTEIQEHGDTMQEYRDKIHTLDQQEESIQHENFRTRIEYYRNHMGGVSSIVEPQTTPQEKTEIEEDGDTIQEYRDKIHTLDQVWGNPILPRNEDIESSFEDTSSRDSATDTSIHEQTIDIEEPKEALEDETEVKEVEELVQDQHSLIQGNSTTLQANSTLIQGNSTIIQENSTTVQGDSTILQPMHLPQGSSRSTNSCPQCGPSGKCTGLYTSNKIGSFTGSHFCCLSCNVKWCYFCRRPRHEKQKCSELTTLSDQRRGNEHDTESDASSDTKGGTQLPPLNPLLSMGECLTCTETTPVMKARDCDVALCPTCTSTYMAGKIDEGVTDIKCPGLQCDAFYHPSIIKTVVEPDKWKRFDYLRVRANMDPERKACPLCDFILMVEDDIREYYKTYESILVCPGCEKEWCFHCEVPWHEGVTCGEYKTLVLTTGVDVWAARAKASGERNAQQCPKCKTWIEKTTGCDMMSCRECKTKFCYACGAKVPHTSGCHPGAPAPAPAPAQTPRLAPTQGPYFVRPFRQRPYPVNTRDNDGDNDDDCDCCCVQ